MDASGIRSEGQHDIPREKYETSVALVRCLLRGVHQYFLLR